eukprot:gene2088-1960_t
MKIDNRTKNKNQLARKYFNTKLKENDTVMVKDIFANKFQKHYLGPFKIKSIDKPSNTIEIEDADNFTRFVKTDYVFTVPSTKTITTFQKEQNYQDQHDTDDEEEIFKNEPIKNQDSKHEEETLLDQDQDSNDEKDPKEKSDFEIIVIINLLGKQQFPSYKFKLNDKYRQMLHENQSKIEKEEKFSWKKFLSELEINDAFAQKFEAANLELDDLQYLTKNDFEKFVKDVSPRIKLMKYIESNYDCKVK